MTKIVNLNKARKSRTRDERKAQADVNSVKFGRTKTEKTQDHKITDKQVRDLDGHKRE
jgi:hypothetical protein